MNRETARFMPPEAKSEQPNMPEAVNNNQENAGFPRMRSETGVSHDEQESPRPSMATSEDIERNDTIQELKEKIAGLDAPDEGEFDYTNLEAHKKAISNIAEDEDTNRVPGRPEVN